MKKLALLVTLLAATACSDMGNQAQSLLTEAKQVGESLQEAGIVSGESFDAVDIVLVSDQLSRLEQALEQDQLGQALKLGRSLADGLDSPLLDHYLEIVSIQRDQGIEAAVTHLDQLRNQGGWTELESEALRNLALHVLNGGSLTSMEAFDELAIAVLEQRFGPGVSELAEVSELLMNGKS